jgi:CHAD domain-containing protein
MIPPANRSIGVPAFARGQCRAQFQRFQKEMRAAQSAGDAAQIHALRVSIRRFRQCLRAFQGVFDPAPLKKLRRRVQKIMDLCEPVRTCDVALDLLRQVGIESGRLVSRIAVARAGAEHKLRKHLKKSGRPDALSWKLELRTLASAKSEWDLKQDLPANLRRILPAMAEEFFVAGRAAVASNDPAALHRFRLRTKHFRYALELFPSFYGHQIAEGIQELRGVQDRLGAINDCISSLDLIRQEGKDRAAMAALKRMHSERTTEFPAYGKKVFSKRRSAWWTRWLTDPKH